MVWQNEYKKLSEIMEIRNEVDTLMGVKETVDNMKACVQHMWKQYDEARAEIKQKSTKIANLKKKKSWKRLRLTRKCKD